MFAKGDQNFLGGVSPLALVKTLKANVSLTNKRKLQYFVASWLGSWLEYDIWGNILWSY